MAKETELKLSLPLSALPKLRRHALLAGLRPVRQRLLNTYYDTDDLALTALAVAVRHRRTGWGWLLTVKSAEAAAGGLARRNEWEAPSQPGAFDFSHVDEARLRARLEALAPRLRPAFTTDFLRTVWMVDFAGASIEVALDRGSVASGERSEPLCELELELVSGPVTALFDLALALQATLPLHPAVASKAERGYRLFLQTPPLPLRAGPSPLTRGMGALAAFRAVARDCVAHLQGNEAGVRAGGDAEFVHQARVAIRRLRSAIRLWRPLLPADFVAAFAPAWRELARTLGEARNLDVFVEETLPRFAAGLPVPPDADGVAAAAADRRERAGRRVRRAFAAPEFSRLLLSFAAAVEALPEPRPGETLEDFAHRRLRALARRIARRREAARADPQACHALRIAGKSLRYSLEFLAPLFSARRVRRYGNALATLQERLGSINDAAVAASLLAVLPRRGKTSALPAWIAGREAALRELLPDALDDFGRAWPPWKRGARP